MQQQLNSHASMSKNREAPATRLVEDFVSFVAHFALERCRLLASSRRGSGRTWGSLRSVTRQRFVIEGAGMQGKNLRALPDEQQSSAPQFQEATQRHDVNSKRAHRRSSAKGSSASARTSSTNRSLRSNHDGEIGTVRRISMRQSQRSGFSSHNINQQSKPRRFKKCFAVSAMRSPEQLACLCLSELERCLRVIFLFLD